MRISIITINLNNLEGLKKTVASVLSQDYPDLEFIVFDGASTDGSAEYLTSVAGKITFVASEKDSGIYNAMNKGIKKATGDYLLFLNSGDYLAEPGILSRCVRQFDEDAAVNYGNIIYYRGEEIYYKVVPPPSLRLFRHNSMTHCTCFIRKDMFEKYGLYDESFRIISDWIFFLRVYVGQEKYHPLDEYVSYYDLGGISTVGTRNDDEHNRAMETYFPNLKTDFEDIQRLVHYDLSKLHRMAARMIRFKKLFI